MRKTQKKSANNAHRRAAVKMFNSITNSNNYSGSDKQERINNLKSRWMNG